MCIIIPVPCFYLAMWSSPVRSVWVDFITLLVKFMDFLSVLITQNKGISINEEELTINYLIIYACLLLRAQSIGRQLGIAVCFARDQTAKRRN